MFRLLLFEIIHWDYIYCFFLSCLFSVVRPYQVTLHAKSKSNNTISSSVVLLLLFFFLLFLVFCEGTGFFASRNFVCHVAWIEVSAVSTLPPHVRVCSRADISEYLSRCLVSPNRLWQLSLVYNKLHIHSRKSDCFFPLEIRCCNSCLVICQGRAPRGPTYKVIYLRSFDHLRTLKMHFLCKIKHLLCEVEYVMKNYHHHRHSYH